MIDKLPYQLTEGVTATRDGIVFGGPYPEIALLSKYMTGIPSANGGMWSWIDAAERLRYRDGEPFATYDMTLNEWTLNAPSAIISPYKGRYKLHRLSAILCDDAEAFRVLHWCIYNLGRD